MRLIYDLNFRLDRGYIRFDNFDIYTSQIKRFNLVVLRIKTDI